MKLTAVLGVLFGGVPGIDFVIPVHSGDHVVALLEALVFGMMALALFVDVDLVNTLFNYKVFTFLL